MPKAYREPHRIKAIGWLRAAVLGANDGIISTASLIIGVGWSLMRMARARIESWRRFTYGAASTWRLPNRLRRL